MVKKNLIISIILLVSLLLAACGAAGQANTGQGGNGGQANTGQGGNGGQGNGGATGPAAGGQPGASGAQGGENPRGLPPAFKLALGTFKLEETAHPLSAEQAGQLLPLWKAARSLGQSQTTAAQELQAIIDQIQGTLTPEQVADLDAMQLGFQDMQAIGQKYGFEIGGGTRPFGTPDPSRMATRQAGGGFQGGFGGPPGGPGGEPGGPGGFSPEARQTAIARGGGNRPGLGLPPALLDAIIKFLEDKAQ